MKTAEEWAEEVIKRRDQRIYGEGDPTIGRKDDKEKQPWNLFPWASASLIVDVLAFGAKKYGQRNWAHVENWRERYFSAAMRHLVAWWEGEFTDPETKLPHLAHAMCCLLFLLEKENGA